MLLKLVTINLATHITCHMQRRTVLFCYFHTSIIYGWVQSSDSSQFHQHYYILFQWMSPQFCLRSLTRIICFLGDFSRVLFWVLCPSGHIHRPLFLFWVLCSSGHIHMSLLGQDLEFCFGSFAHRDTFTGHFLGLQKWVAAHTHHSYVKELSLKERRQPT